MALIKCPECGHSVSTLAKECPNCGCPTRVMLCKDVDHNDANLYDVILTSINGNNRLPTIRFIREINPMSIAEASDIIHNLPHAIVTGVSYELANEISKKLSDIDDSCNIVASSKDVKKTSESSVTNSYLFTKDAPLTCPRCKSSNVTTGTRGYSPIWGFFGSNKTVNRCGKCGHTWRP